MKKVLFWLLSLSICLVFMQCKSIRSIFLHEINEAMQLYPLPDSIPLITPETIECLPVPVQHYVINSKLIGKPLIYDFRLDMEGDFSMRENSKYLKVRTEQYNLCQVPLRFYFIETSLLGIIPMRGRDAFSNGHGHMFGRLAGFRIFDERSYEMDKSGLVTYLNDMVLMPPGCLNPNIRWEPVDSLSARASITYNNINVSAMVYFNEKYELVNFITEDRYESTGNGEYARKRWSTPVTEYGEINGIRMCTAANAVWHNPGGDYVYARFRVKDFRYNIRKY
jgi:hypothetical protein